jgi:hypothetical protein
MWLALMVSSSWSLADSSPRTSPSSRCW